MNHFLKIIFVFVFITYFVQIVAELLNTELCGFLKFLNENMSA